MDDHQFVTIEPGKRGGRPCVRGLRIAVADVLGWLAAGMSHKDILTDYPQLTEDDIRACLACAADRERPVTTRPRPRVLFGDPFASFDEWDTAEDDKAFGDL